MMRESTSPRQQKQNRPSQNLRPVVLHAQKVQTGSRMLTARLNSCETGSGNRPVKAFTNTRMRAMTKMMSQTSWVDFSCVFLLS